jgi:hypothetical protein
MKNLLFFLKIFNKGFKIETEITIKFLNLGIFLCWGCLIASIITGVLETKLENKISDKIILQSIKQNISKLQNDIENAYSFFISLDRLINNNLFADENRKLFYFENIQNSAQKSINYLKIFETSADTKSKISNIEKKLKEFNSIKSSNNETKDYFLNLGVEITEIKFKTFEVLEDERLIIIQLIDENNLAVQNYNKLSSLTFISVFIVQLFIFVFIQLFEISLERRIRNG